MNRFSLKLIRFMLGICDAVKVWAKFAIYIALFIGPTVLADALGFTLEQVMNRNIDKLRKRYPDGFDKARSINREG